MKYYVTFAGLTAPWNQFETKKQAQKFLATCKRNDKKQSKHVLRDEYQKSKDRYRLTFGCGYNLYSSGSIHKI